MTLHVACYPACCLSDLAQQLTEDAQCRQEWRGWTYTGPMLSRRCLSPSLPAPGTQLDAAAPAHLASTPHAAHVRRCNSHWGEAAAATAASEGSTPVAASVGAQPPHQGLMPAPPRARQPSAQAAIGHEPADTSSGRQAYSRPCLSEGGSSDRPASAFDGLALASSSSADCPWHDAMAASTRSLEQSPAALREEVKPLLQAWCKLLPCLVVQRRTEHPVGSAEVMCAQSVLSVYQVQKSCSVQNNLKRHLLHSCLCHFTRCWLVAM